MSDDQSNEPEPKGKRRSGLLGGSLANELQHSLAAHARFSKGLTDIYAMVSAPSRDLARTLQALASSQRLNLDAAFALSSAHSRTIDRFKATVAAHAAATQGWRAAIESTSMLRDIVSGSVLSNLRSTLSVNESAVSQLRKHLLAVSESNRRLMSDFTASLLATTEARATLAAQLQDVSRSATVLQTKREQVLQAARIRLDSLRIDDLQSMVEEAAARDEVFAEWPAEELAEVASQIGAELEAIPDASGWSTEKQLNYLIDWTERQDESRVKDRMISLLINLIAAFMFWVSVEVVPSLIADASRPKDAVNDVRTLLQLHALSPANLAELRVVSCRAAPVKTSSRRRAATVAVLHSGTLVRVVEKRGRWVFIQWTAIDNSEVCEGWVRTKHVTRLAK